ITGAFLDTLKRSRPVRGFLSVSLRPNHKSGHRGSAARNLPLPIRFIFNRDWVHHRDFGLSVSGVAGLLMQALSFSAPPFGGATKVLYDIMLFRSFRKLKPPEEVVRLGSTPTMAI